MKDKQRVYIKGNAERGNEIIKLLEDLGGNNTFSYKGKNKDAYYFINPKGEIDKIDSETPFSGVVFPYVKEFYKEIKLPRWKPKYNERYYSVNWLGRVMSDKWYGTCDDELSYQFGNIFKTHKEAELVRDKIKKLLN